MVTRGAAAPSFSVKANNSNKKENIRYKQITVNFIDGIEQAERDSQSQPIAELNLEGFFLGVVIHVSKVHDFQALVF